MPNELNEFITRVDVCPRGTNKQPWAEPMRANDIHAEQGEFRSEDLRELFDTVDYFVKNLNQKHKTLRHYQTISRFIEGLEGSESMGDDEDHRVWPLCSLL